VAHQPPRPNQLTRIPKKGRLRVERGGSILLKQTIRLSQAAAELKEQVLKGLTVLAEEIEKVSPR